jgi:hypothetical protein
MTPVENARERADDFVVLVVMDAWEHFLDALANAEADGIPTGDLRAILANPDACDLLQSAMLLGADVGYAFGREGGRK